MANSLSREILNLKTELYETLDMEPKLNNRKAYNISLKLDKLIYEYYCRANQGFEKNVKTNMNY